MDVFCRSMRQKWSLTYIDLMAGPGRCVLDDGNASSFDGSPVIAAKQSPPFGSVIAVEQHPDLVAPLLTRLGGFPHARVLQGDCNDPAIISTLRTEVSAPGVLALAFADMLGTDVAFDTIASLTREVRMDLLITFQVSDLARNSEAAYRGEQRDRFDRFFGTPDWARVVKDEYARNHTGGTVASALTDFYAERLGAIGYPCVLPLHRQMKTATEAPLYRLVFASRHPRGVDLFGKVCTIGFDGQRDLF
jgi:three-Cys-motif partner protein